MDKSADQKLNEQEIYKKWEKKGYFKADPESSKKPYSLLMPPPNLTGELHLGHAMQHSIMDAIARFKRMQGFDVLLLPGVDHAGIQFEGTLEKKLAKEGLSKRKLGREEWLKKAWEFKEEMYKSFHKTWTVMGISADWSREVFTLEPKVVKAVFAEFKTFWDQDLLYKGAYIVQWCPKCGTAIEDVEMEYQERKEKLYFVKYLIEGTKNEHITIATARPETIFADVAIAVHPEDKKYSFLVGKKAINPLNILFLPIIEDKRVDKNFGTGALKITPGHDPLDYEIGKDHNLPIMHAVDKTGRMTVLTEDLIGLKVEEARKLTVEKLEKLGVIEKVEEYTHSVPVCERCKTTIEPLISEEWFVKMKPLAQKALKNLKKINFLPKNYEKIISDWLKEIHDWSISRNLWWGHRIPVWYCGKCNPHHLVACHPEFISGSKNQNHEIPKQVRDDRKIGVVVSLNKPDFPCSKCGKNDWVQEEKVLDTWFSSGLWPMATLGWPEETNELKKYYPWDFETSAPEIKYLWIARMIMLGLWFKDEIPFKNMFFHGMLRDMQGRKFSKSLGNGISPYDLVAQWGVDAVRMALYTYSIPGRDGKTSRQLMDERCKNFRNFGTKLRNIARFILELKPEVSRHSGLSRIDSGVVLQGRTPQNDNGGSVIASGAKQSPPVDTDDKEILEKLDKVTQSVTKNLENFSLHLAVDDLYNFVWHDFADIYIEKSKSRRGEAQSVLEKVLKSVLILLHPFMPFISEELYQKFPEHKESAMLELWPFSMSS